MLVLCLLAAPARAAEEDEPLLPAPAAEEPAPAQPPSTVVQLLSIDPIWFIYQTASFRYERLFSGSGTLTIDLRIGRAHVTPESGDPAYDRTLVGLGLGYHFYLHPLPKAPLGFFVAPGVDFLRRYKTIGDSTAAIFIAVPFVELGYNWAHATGFYAGASIGAQYVLGNITDDISGLGSLHGLVPRVSAHLGYAW